MQTPSRATLAPCPAESINPETTGNVFIEGDNLEVLKLLLKPYFGKVKLIYIDPPYNTGKDFIYSDNYTDPLESYLQLTGQSDTKGNVLVSNPETGGRYHSAWLSMMYPRLFLARQLLREDGVIFISLDDNEIHHLRMIMNEIFGEENFVSQFVWVNEGNIDNQSKVKINHEYVLLYAKNMESFPAPSVIDPNISKEDSKLFNEFIENTLTKNGPANPPSKITIPAGFPAEIEDGSITPSGDKNFWPKLSITVNVENKKTTNEFTAESGWSSKDIFEKYISSQYQPVLDTKNQETTFYISKTGSIICKKKRSEQQSHVLAVLKGMGTVQGESKFLSQLGISFDYPKPVKLLKYLIKIGTSKDEIVFDFFAGSCGIAQAALELNQEENMGLKFICVQIPSEKPSENIAEIGKKRIRETIKTIKQSQIPLAATQNLQDLGFKVFKLTKPNIQRKEFSASRDADIYKQELLNFQDPLVANWKLENVLWELALREGYGLNTTFETKTLPNNTIHEVTDPDDDGKMFVVCLDKKINLSIIKEYTLLNAVIFICLDSALDDSSASNLALQCRLKTI